MSDKLAMITYKPKNKNPDSKKVVFGKYMLAGESRKISLKQVQLLENDDEIEITMPEADESEDGDKLISEMKVPELKALAKERKISGYSSMKKYELIEILS